MLMNGPLDDEQSVAGLERLGEVLGHAGHLVPVVHDRHIGFEAFETFHGPGGYRTPYNPRPMSASILQAPHGMNLVIA